MLWLESYYSGAEITYKEGKDNLSDPLSRRPDLAAISSISDDELHVQVSKGYELDPYYDNPVPALKLVGGLWYMFDRLAIPHDKGLRRRIIAECHDCPSSGHLGITKPSSESPGDFGGHIWAVLCTRMYVLVPLAS